jgi:hypothetical protein
MQHEDSKTCLYANLPDFLKVLQDKSLHTVILTWRAEWAPMTATPGVNHGDVVFGSLREITLLAYDKPTGSVLRLELLGPDADRERIRTELKAAGFRVEERKRNLT